MVLANSTALAAGLSDGSIGFSFGGAGFLIWYYLGVVQALKAVGVLHPAVKVAGASSGALITTSHCAGVTPDSLVSIAHGLSSECREASSCSGTLDAHLRKTLAANLPTDAYQRCQNRGWISISTGPLVLGSQPRNLLVGDFKNNDDLVSAAAVSAFIPLWSASSMATNFRGLQAYDGGFSQRQPCPPNVKTCVRVSSRNPVWSNDDPIGGLFSRLGALAQMASNNNRNSDGGGAPPAPRTWPAIESTGADGKPDPALLKLAADAGVDIAPGIFHKLPFGQREWAGWTLSPADDGTLQHMYDLGHADALAWAKHAGVLSGDGGAPVADTLREKVAVVLERGRATATAAVPKAGRKLLAAGGA